MPKLTAAMVEKLTPDLAKRREVPDSILPGLYLQIQPTGAKSWAVRYRHRGRTRKLTLGTVAVLPLALARERGREALQAVAAGLDPATEKRHARTSEADLVRSIVAEFLDRHVRSNNKPRTAEEVERTFRLHVVPAWGDLPLKEITRRDVIALLDAIVDGGKPIAANRAFAAVRKLFNWSIERGIVDTSPCDRVRAPSAEVSRERVLSDDEVVLFWKAAETVGWPFGAMAQLLLLTGQRRDEVAGMRRTEIVGDLWQIPGARTKNGMATEVPLSPAARDIIAAAPRIAASDLVFSTNGQTPFSGFAKGKIRIDVAMLAVARERALAAGSNDLDAIALTPWRLHDLRRTLASGMARLGEPVHVIEAVLNHRGGAISGVAAVYNRHRYLEEKRAALERWAQHIARLMQS
ncbi:MAG: integrase arm-type DNA-binding domain-containing protein [Beijerinckiaceae bacterium]|nr:integrase arm-type DNA-binding domain-containing protein [Beijerinckiaceae bacterium]